MAHASPPTPAAQKSLAALILLTSTHEECDQIHQNGLLADAISGRAKRVSPANRLATARETESYKLRPIRRAADG